MKNCLTCGQEFTPWNKKGKYCTITCFFEYPRQQERLTGLKRCSSCKQTKPITDFYKRTDTKSHKGFRGHCKQCEIRESTIYCYKNKDKIRKRNHKYMKTPKVQFNAYKRSAKKCNKDFKLTLAFFEKNHLKSCFYCGSTQSKALNMGVDRIDSTKGYTEENCVPCCVQCNLSKFTYSTNDFLSHIDKIYNYQHRKEIR